MVVDNPISFEQIRLTILQTKTNLNEWIKNEQTYNKNKHYVPYISKWMNPENKRIIKQTIYM